MEDKNIKQVYLAEFWAKKNIPVVPQLHYSLDPSPCENILFLKTKILLSDQYLGTGENMKYHESNINWSPLKTISRSENNVFAFIYKYLRWGT